MGVKTGLAASECYGVVRRAEERSEVQRFRHRWCFVRPVVLFEPFSAWKRALISVLLLMIAATGAQAVNATLEWDANTETDLSGYRVHYGTTSGVYGTTLDVGNTTRATVSNLLAGQTYFVVATAYNTAGLESAPSNEVSFTAPAGTNQPPAVAMSAPAADSVFAAPANITLSASASDPDGAIARVEFFSGNTKLGERTTAPFTIAWNNVGPGSYTLRAVAWDDRGASTTSAPVAVTVNGAPTVSLSTNGTNFVAPATIVMQAAASDSDGTVARVEFYSGAQKLGERAAAPFSWTLSSAAAGTYILRAAAVDNHGATAWSNEVVVTVTSSNTTSNQAPSVALTAPQGGTIFTAPATITLTAAASDPDGTIARVEFFAGSSLIGTSTTSPFIMGWRSVPSGTYSLTAVAYDNLGDSAASAVVQVTVNAPPSVTVSASTTSTYAGSSVTFEAVASDADGTVRRVEFYSGSILLGKDMNSPFKFTWNRIRAGTHSITAVAYDNQGAATRSAPITVNVSSDGVAAANGVSLPQVRPLGQGYDGSFELDLVGDAGDIYDVWYSEDLKTWSLLISVLNAEGGVIVSDSSADPTGSRFYRVSLQ